MPPLTLLWALIPKRYLIGAGAAIAALLLGLFAIHRTKQHIANEYFQRGYNFAADSAREATILRLQKQHAADEARADSTYRVALQSDSVVNKQATAFISTQRHSPRIEAVALPAGIDTGMVGVYVQNTGEHFILPRNAAQYWHTSDSLVTVASQLLAKYAAANKQWASAWQDEHNARIGADSLAEQWRLRAHATIPVHQASVSWKRRAAYAAVWLTLGMVAHNNIHLRIR